jgi:hypothetical protein
MLSVDASRVVAGFFIANTVPAGEFGWPDFKTFLRRYRSRFERRWPGIPAYWVKELTSTGTPHLHLVVLWLHAPPSLTEFRKWNDNAWADVVKSSHPSHRDVGCRVDLVRSYVGSAAYLSSYLTQAKKVTHDDGTEEVQRQSDTGKMWGCINKKHLPIRWESDTITGVQGTRATRVMRKWRERKGTFWLHSSRSHSPSHLQGAAVEWHSFRRTYKNTLGHAWSAAQMFWVGEMKRAGYRVRRRVPRLFRNLRRPIWSVDVESGKFENNGEEIHAAVSGWHFIDVKHFGKLLRFVKGTGAAALTRCEERWAKNGTFDDVRPVRDIRIDGSRLAGGSAARGAARISRDDLRWLHECGWFDALPVEQSDSA